MGIISFEEYKDKPLMVIAGGETDRYPFKFGLKKAKLVIEHIEDIRKWVAEQEALAKSAKDSEGDAADA